MKHYKDDCHHYKVIDNYTVIQVHNQDGTSITKAIAAIALQNYGKNKHHLIEYIKEKKVTPCTEAEYQTAFDKALKTINNLKN